MDRIDSVRVDFDRDYGIENRTGWSLSVNGSYLLQFVSLLRVLVRLFAEVAKSVGPSPLGEADAD